MAARGYPPRTCRRCPAGSRRAASSPAHSYPAPHFLPAHEWRITGNPRRTPANEKKPARWRARKRTRRVSVSWHAPSCRDRSNSCRARSAAARGSDRRRRRCRNAAPPGRGRPAPALHAAGAIVVAGVEHQLIDPGTEVLACSTGWSQRPSWLVRVVAISSSCWPSTRYSLDLDAMAGAASVWNPVHAWSNVPWVAGARWRTPLLLLPSFDGDRSGTCLAPLACSPPGAACELAYKLSFDELYTKTPPQPKIAAAAPKSGIPSTSPTPQGLILR